jgi:TfoX/Sxy family transcriptional regulator of competence genes
MAYNQKIEERIQDIVDLWMDTTAKKMFGGVCHLQNGNMFCGVHKDFLILRLGEKGAAGALDHPHAKPFDITGRPMKGWVMMAEEGFPQKADLKKWLTKARKFAETLPPK